MAETKRRPSSANNCAVAHLTTIRDSYIANIARKSEELETARAAFVKAQDEVHALERSHNQVIAALALLGADPHEGIRQ